MGFKSMSFHLTLIIRLRGHPEMSSSKTAFLNIHTYILPHHLGKIHTYPNLISSFLKDLCYVTHSIWKAEVTSLLLFKLDHLNPNLGPALVQFYNERLMSLSDELIILQTYIHTTSSLPHHFQNIHTYPSDELISGWPLRP